MSRRSPFDPLLDHARHAARPINVAALLLVAAWPIAVLDAPASVVMIGGLVVGATWLAMETGSPAMAQWAVLLFLAVMGIVAANDEVGPTGFALLGATAIVVGGLLGVGTGLRRGGRIDPGTLWRIVGAHAAVSLVAVGAVFAVEGVPERELEWPIVPTAIGLLFTAATALWWTGRRQASPDDTTRWLPGAPRQATVVDDGLGGPPPPTG